MNKLYVKGVEKIKKILNNYMRGDILYIGVIKGFELFEEGNAWQGHTISYGSS